MLPDEFTFDVGMYVNTSRLEGLCTKVGIPFAEKQKLESSEGNEKTGGANFHLLSFLTKGSSGKLKSVEIRVTDSDRLQEIYSASSGKWPGGIQFISEPTDWATVEEGRPVLFQGQFTLDAGQQVLPNRYGRAELCTIRGLVGGSKVVINFDSSKAGQSSNWLTMQRKKECPVQCLGYVDNVELGGAIFISPITMGYACRLPWTWGYE